MVGKRWRGVLGVLLVASVGVFGLGCPADEPAADEPSTEVRFIHASPDAPAVDVYQQGREAPLFTNVEYGGVTEYRSVLAGPQVFELRPAGAEPTSAPVFTAPTTLPHPDRSMSLVVAGLLGATEPEQGLRVLLVDEVEPAETAARLRLVHAVPDLPTLSLDVREDGSVDVPAIGRFQSAAPGGLPVPPGQSLQLALLAGEPPVTVSRFTLPALTEGARVLLIATGLAGQQPGERTGLTLLVVGAEGRLHLVRQNPLVYVLHASPDAPAVDLFFRDVQLVENLSFGELSGPMQVPTESAVLDFFGHVAGDFRPPGAPAASREVPAPEAGERYLLVATGFLSPGEGRPGFTLVPLQEAFAQDADALRLRLVHASPDAPVVDVGPLAVDGTVPMDALFDDVAFGQASPPEGAALTGGLVAVGVAPAAAEDRTPVATFELDPSPLVGRGVFAVAAGALAPMEDEEGFRLLLVDTFASPWTVTPVRPR